MNEDIEFSITSTDEDVARTFQAQLQHSGLEPHATKRRGLDGGAAAWIVFATLGIKMIPQLLDFALNIAKLNKVEKIKIGDAEITNPTRKDVEDLKQLYLQQQQNGKDE